MTVHDEVTSIGQLPGVYLISGNVSLGELKGFAAAHDFQLISLSGQETQNKESFLREAARAMGFPTYFGENWDAFDECVRDLSWMPAKGYVVVYDEFDHLALLDSAAWNSVLTIFHEATEYWWQRHIPMYVLLRGCVSAAPGLPLLRVA